MTSGFRDDWQDITSVFAKETRRPSCYTLFSDLGDRVDNFLIGGECARRDSVRLDRSVRVVGYRLA